MESKLDYEKRVEKYNEIIRLRKERYTLKEIGEMFGVSHQAIQNKIKKGFPRETIRKYKDALGDKFQGRDRARELARVRDNHTCQNCGRKWVEGERRLDIHHLNGLCGKLSQSYDKTDDLSGLITLCHKCHFNRYDHSRKKKNPLTINK